jgi:hypothetical protein
VAFSSGVLWFSAMRTHALGWIVAVAIAAHGLLAAGGAEAATAIGKVSRLLGVAEGTVEGAHRVLAADDAVYLDEKITTGGGARLEMTLDDATVLTVGENATLTLDTFVYNPRGENRLAATVVGAFRYVSGTLLAGASRQASVTTPFAVLGVRGTDFWGGPIDGGFGVFVFEGAVSVTNAGGTVLLSAPGQGTSFPNAAAPPGPITVWAQDKVDRAVATITFP